MRDGTFYVPLDVIIGTDFIIITTIHNAAAQMCVSVCVCLCVCRDIYVQMHMHEKVREKDKERQINWESERGTHLVYAGTVWFG